MKEVNLKSYILYNSNFRRFWKRQNYEYSKNISGCQRLGEWVGWIGSTQRIFRSVKLSCTIIQWWIHVIIHLSKLIKCTTSRMNPNVNCGLRVIMICHHCNKRTTLVGDVNNGGGCVYVEREGMWELSVLSAQFYCEPKISIKIKFIN